MYTKLIAFKVRRTESKLVTHRSDFRYCHGHKICTNITYKYKNEQIVFSAL